MYIKIILSNLIDILSHTEGTFGTLPILFWHSGGTVGLSEYEIGYSTGQSAVW